jgi:hypothetical protein
VKADSSSTHRVATDFKAKKGAGLFLSRPRTFGCKRPPGEVVPKLAVIREEFVALTGNPFIAVILNQLLYWTKRLPDFDYLMEEEFSSPLPLTPSCECGWFYKTSQELTEETLLCLSRYTMRNYLRFLIEEGWISERLSPQNKWNKTTQYRVNLRQLQMSLCALGYALPSFTKDELSILEDSISEEMSVENVKLSAMLKSSPSKEQNSTSSPPNPSISPMLKTSPSNGHQHSFECGENQHSNVENLPLLYLTETTSENTNREHTSHAREKPREKSILMADVWRRLINPEGITLTDARKRRLESHLETYFQNNLARWEKFCRRIQVSPFLMGEGARGWRITLDWILIEDNLLKVLEGNFDDPHSLQLETTQKVCSSNPTKISKILESIEDPVWRGWCTQFSEGIRLNETRYLVEPLKIADLERIAKAQFLELENEKLLWVGSSDSSVLSKIEDLRLTLSSYFMRTYPKFRTIRTCLITDNETFSSLIQEITPTRKD